MKTRLLIIFGLISSALLHGQPTISGNPVTLEDWASRRNNGLGAGNPLFGVYLTAQYGADPNQTNSLIANPNAYQATEPLSITNPCGSTPDGCGVYWNFIPLDSGGGYNFPNSYVQYWIKSGAWNPTFNRMWFYFSCTQPYAPRPDGGENFSIGTYIRNQAESGDNNQGAHYYHSMNLHVVPNAWQLMVINPQPQHEVGGPTTTPIFDPDYNTNELGSPYHYFDAMTRWYWNMETGSWTTGEVCTFLPISLGFAPSQPDAWVSSITAQYTGTAYEVRWAEQGYSATQFSVAYSTTGSMIANGFSSGTSGGTVTGRSDAYPGVSWTSPALTQASSFWVAIRPAIPITSYTPGSPPSINTGNAHNLATGDSVTVAGVDPSVNGTYTIASTGFNTFTLNAVTGAGSYVSGGTVTAADDKKNFAEIRIDKIALLGSTVSPCDLNADGVVNSTDVGLAVNMVLGTQACTTNLDGSGSCTVVDVQRIVDAALGGTCQVGP